jgi:hypothetical protein
MPVATELAQPLSDRGSPPETATSPPSLGLTGTKADSGPLQAQVEQLNLGSYYHLHPQKKGRHQANLSPMALKLVNMAAIVASV